MPSSPPIFFWSPLPRFLLPPSPPTIYHPHFLITIFRSSLSSSSSSSTISPESPFLIPFINISPLLLPPHCFIFSSSNTTLSAPPPYFIFLLLIFLLFYELLVLNLLLLLHLLLLSFLLHFLPATTSSFSPIFIVQYLSVLLFCQIK